MTINISCGNGANNSDSRIFYIRVSDDAVPTAPSEVEIMEGNKIRYRVIPGNMQTQRPITVSHKWSPKSYYQLKDVMDNQELAGLCQGTVGTEPIRQPYFVFGLCPNSAMTTAGSTQIRVLIEYVVRYFDPINLPQS